MGNKKSKPSVNNKCDCLVNQKHIIKPFEYKINNGFYYIYFELKHFDKNEENKLQFSWFDQDNNCLTDYVIININKLKSKKVNINKLLYLEYELETDNKYFIKIRYSLSKTKHILLFILPIN